MVHPKLRPFHYLSDANYPMDNPSVVWIGPLQRYAIDERTRHNSSLSTCQMLLAFQLGHKRQMFARPAAPVYCIYVLLIKVLTNHFYQGPYI